MMLAAKAASFTTQRDLGFDARVHGFLQLGKGDLGA
jgi:hypothetical protein